MKQVTFIPKVDAQFCKRRNNNVEYTMMMLIVFETLDGGQVNKKICPR